MSAPARESGLLACFASEDGLLEALRAARRAGYTRFDTYLPYSVEEALEASVPGRSPVAKAMLIGGFLSGAGAYFMQYYAARDYPVDVGGRPLDSWPSFVPITFELTVLGASLTGLVALLFLLRLPRLDHPVWSDPAFLRASRDRFFLCIWKDDPRFEGGRTKEFLSGFGAESVREIKEGG